MKLDSRTLMKEAMPADAHLRLARPTRQLEQVVRFYTDGLGLRILGSFEDHEGFDGVMLGRPGSSFHLEFTRRRGPASRKEAEDQLLVFYLPERETWQRSVDRLRRAGYQAVPSSNPYWDGHGLTFEDPDGNRVVLDNSRWSP